MNHEINRRDLLALLGVGGLTFVSGSVGCGAATPGAPPAAPRRESFSFLQLSDTHWGFQGPPNPHADVTLERAVATINAAEERPDFVVFTGDLTHMADDDAQRLERMKRFREIVSTLKIQDQRFLPGEHDAMSDHGQAYRAIFGDPFHAFEHKGAHFIALDNASAPGGALGDAQLAWLRAEVARVPQGAQLIVLAHRPLFPLFPTWDWATKDGDRALSILDAHDDVTVFYGHIHQEHHFKTGRIAHHASKSLVFPLPAPGSVAHKIPLPWSEASADHGLGWRAVELGPPGTRFTEIAYAGAAAAKT